MKTAIISITLLLLLFSNISFTQHFAPLRVGNIWVYLVDDISLSRCEVVDDSVMVDSLLYYQLLIDRWTPNLHMTRYVRMEGDFYRCKTNFFNGFEEIYYKENANVGDIWYQEYDTVSYNEVVDAIGVNIFGQSTTLKNLQVNSYGLLVQYNEYWTEEFGKHLEIDFWGYTIMMLQGCVIDGVAYGDTTFYNPIGVNEEKTLDTYALYQNYPNPFNPTTNIAYSIPELSFVTMKVYDVLGNEIATVVSKELPAGSYKVEYESQGFTSGVYFYRLQAGSFVETKKMVLMK